jgi:glycosyltransferase involved in cell wall biosynthesis
MGRHSAEPISDPSFNLGILSHFFPPDIGGIPRLHSYTVDSYLDFGVRPVVVAGGQVHTEINRDYPVLRSPEYSRAFELRRQIRCGKFGDDNPFERSGWDHLIADLSRTVAEFFTDRNVTMVNSHVFSDLRVGSEVAKLLGTPHVHVGHSSYRSASYLRKESKRLRTRAPFVTQEYVRRTLETAAVDLYIVHSRHVHDKYVEMGVTPDRIRVLPPAVDVSMFRRDDGGAQKLRSRFDLGEASLITCPTLRKGGFDQLLCAFSLFCKESSREAYLLCCDSHAVADDYRRMVKDAGLDDRVIFTSFSPEAMPAVYTASDVVVMCSIEEGIGLPALEARACGTPVVANRFGPFVEYIDHERDGLLVERGDAGGLAAHLGRVVSDQVLRRRLSTAGVERAQEYSHTLLAGRYISIFETYAD